LSSRINLFENHPLVGWFSIYRKLSARDGFLPASYACRAQAQQTDENRRSALFTGIGFTKAFRTDLESIKNKRKAVFLMPQSSYRLSYLLNKL
jgi:hypothetical protein